MNILGLEPKWLLEKRKRDLDSNYTGYRVWEQAEKAKAISLLKMGKDYDYIAEELNRTKMAVAYMLRKEGYAYRSKTFWNTKDIRYVEDHMNEMSNKEMADVLKRTPKAVGYKKSEIKKLEKKFK